MNRNAPTTSGAPLEGIAPDPQDATYSDDTLKLDGIEDSSIEKGEEGDAEAARNGIDEDVAMPSANAVDGAEAGVAGMSFEDVAIPTDAATANAVNDIAATAIPREDRRALRY